ncbi:uncharacterized protein SAPINGB_P004045 [Magnusiomyces paraingens]|uniref:Endonuclease/exonuclease/phosphatase domain-containing protein n=1 Tax=Magnusiomyces paraingens TaxID=2606893 RepID=A0A5E8BXY1_9ASCO|nr:uncharacterized protein SAPINGB_P004045 [Saprochaete ingens]VVT54377.1 unnamed protein product [Saprochaete ingens]
MGVREDKWKWVGKVLGPTDWFSLFLEQYSKIVIAGDYNLHHKEWESRAGPNTEADEVVEWLHENDMMLITPRNQKTYNNRTNIDLVYGSVDLLHRISFSGVDENTLSDHSIVEWDISMSQSKNGDEVFTSVKRLNIKNADWEKFDKELSSAIKDFNVHNKTLKSTDQIDDQAKVLEEVVKRAMAKSMKEVKVMKKSKRYWNQELREKKEDGTLTTTVDEKRHEIWKALLPEIDHGLDREFEIDDDSRWPKLEFDEVDSALADTPNDKAPGDDGITGKVLKMAWLNKDFKERFFKLLQACVKFGYHPKVWRHGIIVVIPKPKKPDYSKPRAYRPISLLKIPSKKYIGRHNGGYETTQSTYKLDVPIYEKVQLTLPNGELREPQKEVKLLGITLNNLLDFKSHILNKINKARKAVGAIWHLGGVQKNMALRRIVGAYRTTPIAVLQKEAGIMPYSIRLKFMVARKAIRLHLNISKTNPINGHLLTLIEKSPIAKLTTLYMLAKR